MAESCRAYVYGYAYASVAVLRHFALIQHALRRAHVLDSCRLNDWIRDMRVRQPRRAVTAMLSSVRRRERAPVDRAAAATLRERRRYVLL